MRLTAAGPAGRFRLPSSAVLLLFLGCFLPPAASAGALAGGLKQPVGHGAASTTTHEPGVPVQCTDIQTGSAFQYQAQHLFSSGLVDHQWMPDPSERCLGSNSGFRGRPVDDGLGGEYYAWVDARSGESDIYAQHLTASGDTCAGWGHGGVPVCVAARSQYNLDATGDAQGGLLLAWQDFRMGRNSVVYCARVSAGGEAAPGWAAGGIAMSEESADQLTPQVAADGVGGAFVFWLQRQTTGLALRAQHLDALGSIATGWSRGGVELVPASQHVVGVVALADSAGTASVFWRCSPDAGGPVLRMARLNNGVVPDSSWSNNAISFSTRSGATSEPVLLRNADGGLLAAWSENSEAGDALKLERFTRDGEITPGWPQSGVTVVAAGVGMSPPALLTDGGGGAIVAWEDRRGESGHIRAHRVDGDGKPAREWGEGTLVCDANGEQHAPMIAPDGNGGMIVTWVDDATSTSGAFPSGSDAADAVPAFLRVETNAGYARLIWSAPPAAGSEAHAYREDGDAWLPLGQVTADDSSHFVVEDRNAPAGAYANYRLSVTSNGGEIYLTPVTVFVPNEPTVLELQRAWAPSRGNYIVIEFAMPRGPAPRAEIFDVTGRRVGDLLLGQYTPGVYRTQVPFESRTRSGIFFLRLSQGPTAINRRVVVIR